MPEELLKELDEQAKNDYSSRSDYIRMAVVNQLRSERALKADSDQTNQKGSSHKVEIVDLTQKLIKRHRQALKNLSQ